MPFAVIKAAQVETLESQGLLRCKAWGVRPPPPASHLASCASELPVCKEVACAAISRHVSVKRSPVLPSLRTRT